jgi:hypothetical protein
MELTHIENKKNNQLYENININRNTSLERINVNYENIELKHPDPDHRTPKCGSPYENIHLQPSNTNISTHSPRTRIKTIASSNREG